jgi:poly-gamma-glutamate synthesis protein (capsule biosynthesis protein)
MMAEDAGEALMYAVGDVAPNRPNPDELFSNVAVALRKADLAFCQLELNLSARGVRLPQVRHTDRGAASTAHAFKRAGFNVVSMAGNHCMDWGADAFFDTIAAVQDAGLHVVGAGANIAAARKPVIVEAQGRRIAFLAYSSILPANFWAEENRPGCAPMRAWTIYVQIEPDQPGTPSRIHTFANRDDLQALVADVRQVKPQVDAVFVSLHWGIHFVPAVIADYQRDVAYAAIDAGADVILGHHAHILKGAELYKGKPIFYSLCNFAVDLPMDRAHAQSKGFREIQTLHPNWQPDFDSTYNFPPESSRTIVVKCVIAAGGVKQVSFLPAYINRNSQPELLSCADPRFSEVVDYMREITDSQGLNGQFIVAGGEVSLQSRQT